MEALLDTLSALVATNLWIGPLIAFVAGIAASFTPCCLSSVPIIVGYVSGYSGGDKRTPFQYSVVYAFGASITMVALGALAAVVGELLHEAGRWWYVILAALMVLMAFQMWGKVNIFPHVHHVHGSRRRGFTGALLLGAIGGAFSSPCSAPVLIAILAVVAGGGLGVVSGVLMLLMYALGHSLLVVAAGTSTGWALRISESPSMRRAGKIVNLVGGVVMVAFAAFLVWLAFFAEIHH